jgi:hypothetical protein
MCLSLSFQNHVLIADFGEYVVFLCSLGVYIESGLVKSKAKVPLVS